MIMFFPDIQQFEMSLKLESDTETPPLEASVEHLKHIIISQDHWYKIDISEKDHEIAGLKRRVADLQEAAKDARNQSEDMRYRDDAIAMLTAEVLAGQELCSKQLDEIKQLNLKIGRLGSQKLQLYSKIGKLNAEKRTEIDKLNSEIEKLNSEKQKQINQLNLQINQLKSEKDELNAERQEQIDTIREWESDIERFEFIRDREGQEYRAQILCLEQIIAHNQQIPKRGQNDYTDFTSDFYE